MPKLDTIGIKTNFLKTAMWGFICNSFTILSQLLCLKKFINCYFSILGCVVCDSSALNAQNFMPRRFSEL
ncbi:hypothetical protein [Campylobacter majalis]|uniref:hypothetical protein n=1 Tax=Campylobacter majalis TaxID=2790656 RepID=UPI001E45314E|nr:hypothetical protein [Campylobacter majalis]